MSRHYQIKPAVLQAIKAANPTVDGLKAQAARLGVSLATLYRWLSR